MVCEKIHSWHLASADDEINSARGCGSAMSTGHTPRFDRNESATNPRNGVGGKENTSGRKGQRCFKRKYLFSATSPPRTTNGMEYNCPIRRETNIVGKCSYRGDVNNA